MKLDTWNIVYDDELNTFSSHEFPECVFGEDKIYDQLIIHQIFCGNPSFN